jgi:hypothetical protein
VLAALQPTTEPPDVPPAPGQPAVAVTEDLLRRVLKALPHGWAGGPSGLTYEHVKAAANSSDAAFDAIRCLLNVMLSGKLPHLPELIDATLVAFDKPAGGVRPIAIGEVW